ncbi:hypothetical protein [Leptospira kanakyensis]|uniref:hypothetical protein n=1 Tax=Leptospira kanakyensis TaxID=2484968 RepID=UPI00223CEA28|nr:hypothetical protein [Leptospira kanakyensis]MCW7481766.1 hypothetical protein [Leptospira kanakyensis]
MSPLFSKLAKVQTMTSFGKWGLAPTLRGNPPLFAASTSQENLEVRNLGLGKTKKLFQSSHTKSSLGFENPELDSSPSKPKTVSRWASFIGHQSSSKQVEVADLKPIWNYLLGETGFSDLLSYIHPDSKESLQMVVEPKNKGLVLYVFWESKETGAMGIQFHYDPEKEKPIFVQLTTERSFQGEDFTKSFVGLIRDFPQIRSVQMETWKEESFNGDYR